MNHDDKLGSTFDPSLRAFADVAGDGDFTVTIHRDRATLVAALLRMVAARARLTQRQLAPAVDGSQSKVSRILSGNGNATMTEGQCREWLRLCNASPREIDLLDQFLGGDGKRRAPAAAPRPQRKADNAALVRGLALTTLQVAMAKYVLQRLAEEGPQAMAEAAVQMANELEPKNP